MASSGITESFKIFIDLELRKFTNNCDAEEYEFYNDFNHSQRKYIHEKCRKMGLTSKSYGKEPHRKLVLKKRKKPCDDKIFCLAKNENINNAINSNLSNYISKTWLLKKKHPNCAKYSGKLFGSLSPGGKIAVPAPRQTQFLEFRKTLPVWLYRNNIIGMLSSTQVLLITSETGSGKTTQIPQFLLEDAQMKDLHCKIICTQPRRLTTVTIAERVAAERGEKIGDTVGYQIKLESQIGWTSALVYCTNGVLLRTLMNGIQYLKTVTHIIIDEIHERDKYSDFLLIALKQNLQKFPHLKLILMSATADCGSFMNYFETDAILNIPGKLFPIERLFLEDILVLFDDQYNQLQYNVTENIFINEELVKIDDCIHEDMTSAILKCISNGDEDSFMQMINLIMNDNGNINHQTPLEGYTPLMAAAKCGNINIAEQLLNLGADTSLKCRKTFLTASQLASLQGTFKVRDIISEYNASNFRSSSSKNIDALLEAYDRNLSDEAIDYKLIVEVLKHIHQNYLLGTVLVFLPGYEDIILCQQQIYSSSLNLNELEVLILHGSMSAGAQRNVFKMFPNKQKVILSTNIAETSITIPDVVYVIDTGKAKEKTYDSLTGVSGLQKMWISKANIEQRAGRAGRTQPGVCYHLFSKKRYNSLHLNPTPEILRVPLHELCLQTKLLAPNDVKIIEFLQNAIEPPSSINVQNSIESLKILGALDSNENLSLLGKHLLRFSVDPRLGKMLIYATIFKCIDPILSIVAILSYKEPFVLPTDFVLKKLAVEKQKQLADKSLSDHFGLLKAFQVWQDSKSKGTGKKTDEYFINKGAMEMISATRTQLMSQLRSVSFVQSRKPFTVQDLNVNSNCWPLVKAVLTVGCYPNIAFYRNNNFVTRTANKISFNKTSCLSDINQFSNVENCCIIYEELTKIGNRCSVKCGTVVTALTVALMCSDINDNDYSPSGITIDGWLKFEHTYDKLILFRQSISELINVKIIDQNYSFNANDEAIVNTLINILLMEDNAFNFIQPMTLGLVPKLNLDSSLKYRSAFNHGLKRNYQASYCNPSTYRNVASPSSSSTCNAVPNNHFSANNIHSKNINAFGTQNMMDVINSTTSVVHQRTSSRNPGDILLHSITAVVDKSCILENSVYFLIKPLSQVIFEQGMFANTLTLTPRIEDLIFKLFLENRPVILFISINNTKKFQALAKLTNTNGGDVRSSCSIKVLSRKSVEYHAIKEKNIRNGYNDNLLLYCGKDGQQIEPSAGRILYGMFFK